MITWQERFKEWSGLFDYCCENKEELIKEGKMKALVLCLQIKWRDMRRLRRLQNAAKQV